MTFTSGTSVFLPQTSGSQICGRKLFLTFKCGPAIPRFCILRCRVRTPQQEGKAGTRQRAAKQEQRRSEMESYRTRLTGALEAEMMEEMSIIKERLTWSKKRLQDEGLALFDLSVRPDGQLYRDNVFRFFLAKGTGFLPMHHQFSQGDVVTISRRSPVDFDDPAIEGVVMERARRFLKVAVSSKQAGEIDRRLTWRLDLSANRVAFERCIWAVNSFASPEIRSRSTYQPSGNQSSKALSQVSSSGTAPTILPTMGEGVMSFRDAILSAESLETHRESFADNTTVDLAHSGDRQEPSVSFEHEALSKMSAPPSRISGKNLGNHKGFVASLLKDLETDANTSQKNAIQKAMLRRVTLWQGPPGTGKTRTLVRLIKGLCHNSQGKVLASADSNIAVDNLVEGLLGQGLRVVRVGQPVKVKDELRDATVAAQVSAHPLMEMARHYRDESMVGRRAARQMKNDKKRKAGAIQAAGLWEKAAELEQEAIKEILNRADVVAATCVGAGDPILDGRQFRACVIDEATQATEPASLIPILRSGADTVVLVGDPAQLPPTVISQDALQAGLSTSLFEHLEKCGLDPILLNTQYRMHPFLASWPSKTFYGSKLLSHILPSDRPLPRGLEWPNVAKPAMFIECANGVEEKTPLGNSWFNRAEAFQVVQTVALLTKDENMDLSCQDVGVISPYGAQVRLLQDLFTNAEATEGRSYSNLEVKTVDGFQGREKEVMVISTVRSNSEGNLGFVTDPRRMNVALTRAKRGLVVVGNSRTLSANYHWRQWLQIIKNENLIAKLGKRI